MTEKLQLLIERSLRPKKIAHIALAVSKPGVRWVGAAGGWRDDQPYFIASTTKLYVTAILLQLVDEGVLELEDPLSRHLDENILRGLHVHRGHDYGPQLLVRHLLSHGSGLPDYFQARRADGRSLLEELLQQRDTGWSFADAIQATKAQGALFPPGETRAHYSDSNFQLLGRIIENRTESELAEALRRRIGDRLGLSRTYLYTDPEDRTPADIQHKANALHIPKAMASFRADGGVVSTAAESLAFIEGFFGGKLFDAAVLPSLERWRRIFFPLQSGVGLHRFQLPRIFSPFRAAPEFLGHSGLSGAFAFHCRKENLFLAGTVNQLAYPDQSFRLMMKAAAIAQA